jgi:TolB-like protein/AraC-like DNA-binding protein
MPDAVTDNEFLKALTDTIGQNIANEQFGVSELAGAMNMSRSNLLRKVKKLTNLSVSQLISQVRLQKGMHLLQTTGSNVSEVAHQVGFNSPSYFIKCFREYYGYPPGEVGKGPQSTVHGPQHSAQGGNGVLTSVAAGPTHPRPTANIRYWPWVVLVVLLALGGTVYYIYRVSTPSPGLEKSIAVLPFKNDSADSTNLYLINGLMESTLNNLQKIKDLKVISRTSTEKYRYNARSIPEMARELQVNYFIEGSGQKIGDQILLNIQLIEGPTDRHLWSKQYRREARDIFALQQEIAKSVAAEIQAVITPEEQQRIEKIPTENLEAYDHFLKGRNLFYNTKGAELPEALDEMHKAIALDPQFATAYAEAALIYYYRDIFMIEKKYGAELHNYADKALLYDPKLDESLVAKALSYVYKADFESAVLYLEKALEYNPNSGLAINFLSEFYNMHVPNTAKYLEYSLRGVQMEIGSGDSTTLSHRYLHASNALMQGGFIDEALVAVNKSVAYNPRNFYSGFLSVYVRFAKTKCDLTQVKAEMLKELAKDTTQFVVIQEVAKICYYMRDYPEAYRYYRKFIAYKDAMKLDVFTTEDIKVAIVLNKLGFKEQSAAYLAHFKQYADKDKSIYKHLLLASYYSYTGNTPKAIEHLRLFSKEEDYSYWVLLFESEPTLEPINDLPEVKAILKNVEKKFWAKHEKLKADLEEKELLAPAP